MSTKTKISSGIYSLGGKAFVNISATSQNKLNSLIFSKGGQPWYGIGILGSPVINGNIKAILKVNWANVKTANKAIGH